MENQNDNTEMIKNLTNILEGLDNSQEQLEKNAFDVINSCLLYTSPSPRDTR